MLIKAFTKKKDGGSKMDTEEALAALKRQLDELTEELADTKEAARTTAKGGSSTVYILPSERKLKAFSGTDSPAISHFIEEVQAALKLRKLNGVEAADFILSYLEGAARQEIRHQPKSVSTNPDQILKTLKETFGERRSLGSLMREICNRVQKDGETVAEFAFKLMALADELAKIPGAPDADQTIKEQFRDGLGDGVLRREIKRMMMEEPNKPFIKIRDWALDMAEEETDLPRRRNRRVAINSAETAQENHIVHALEGLTKVVRDQAGIMEGMKAQQMDFNTRLAKLETEATNRRRPRVDKKDIQCRRCLKMGHYASECRSPAPVSATTASQGNGLLPVP